MNAMQTPKPEKLPRRRAFQANAVMKKGSKRLVSAGTALAAAEIPPSLNWIFGFGFKVGIFLILKSFLILRYQHSNLQLSGLFMIITQFLQSLVLIICGMLMQNRALYDDPHELHRISRFYGYALLLGTLIFLLRENLHWQFFKSPRTVNWFVDFFSSVSKGLGEFSLSVLFWDCDLWGAFCGLLYLTIAVYLNVHYDCYSGLLTKLWNRIRAIFGKGRAEPAAIPPDSDEAV